MAAERVGAMARILLVDDDPALLSALPEALARRLSGCEIVTADCGETALFLLRNNGIDLVISDLLMSGVGGTKLLEALEQIGPAVPTIIMTGMIETQGEKLPAGAVGVVRKPFDVSTLAQMIREVLDKRSVSQS
jgi:DNA-binding NtrC family response regulator